MRMDAIDAALGIENPTPRTIEGPLYVAGAPVAHGFARMDDGSDPNGHTLILHGTIYAADGQPLPNAQVEIWHANTKGFYSHFDPTGEQQPFNMRRTIMDRCSRSITVSKRFCLQVMAVHQKVQLNNC